MPSPLRPCLALALALAVPLAACGEDPPPPVSYDPEQVIAEAVALDQLERLDVAPVASVHGNGDGFAEFYANEAAAEVFRSIDGSDPSATATFPRGSILVKNNLGPDMQPVGVLTILSKFEEGYSEDTRDWFFAMVDMQGNVLDETVGSGIDVVFCYDCHSQMGSNTDLVIGLAPDELR